MLLLMLLLLMLLLMLMLLLLLREKLQNYSTCESHEKKVGLVNLASRAIASMFMLETACNRVVKCFEEPHPLSSEGRFSCSKADAPSFDEAHPSSQKVSSSLASKFEQRLGF
jgi:hypothetical protein